MTTDRYYPVKVEQKLVCFSKLTPSYQKFFFEEGEGTLREYLNQGWRIRLMMEKDPGHDVAILMEKGK